MRFLLVAVLLLGLLAQRAASQAIVNARIAGTASALRVGTPVRIVTVGGYVDGLFLRAVTDSLALGGRAGERRVALAAVDSLWAGQRNTRGGAAIGAVIGGVGGAALGGLFVASLCDAAGGCRNDYPKAIGAGLVLGSGAGALLGAFVGAATHRWRRLYP